jgi:hypothetical protein
VRDEGLETREGNSQIRLKTVDEIIALFRFDDPYSDSYLRILTDTVMGNKTKDAAKAQARAAGSILRPES